MAVDDECGIGLVAAQHLIDRVSHGSQLRRVELSLREYRGVPGGKEQVVAISQGHLELFGEVEQHRCARARATGLDEAQMTRGDACLQPELELAEPALLTPLSQQCADRGTTRDHRHAGDPSPPTAPNSLPLRSWTSSARTGSLASSIKWKGAARWKQPKLVESYLDTWNETDPDARRSAVASVWAEDAQYVDPLASVSGHDQISDLIGGVHQQAPGHVFRLLDDRVDTHHNLVRFSWELVPASGGESLAVGFDVAVTGEDGRIRSVFGFLDKVPGG